MTTSHQNRTDEPESISLPTATEFYFDVPLYKFYQLAEDQGPYVSSIEFMNDPIDAYCIYCDYLIE